MQPQAGGEVVVSLSGTLRNHLLNVHVIANSGTEQESLHLVSGLKLGEELQH